MCFPSFSPISKRKYEQFSSCVRSLSSVFSKRSHRSSSFLKFSLTLPSVRGKLLRSSPVYTARYYCFYNDSVYKRILLLTPCGNSCIEKFNVRACTTSRSEIMLVLYAVYYILVIMFTRLSWKSTTERLGLACLCVRKSVSYHNFSQIRFLNLILIHAIPSMKTPRKRD